MDMDRRQFLHTTGSGLATWALYGTSVLSPLAQAATATKSNLTVAGAITALHNLRITPTLLPHMSTAVPKDLSGALLQAPLGMLNWYFANLSLLFSLDSLSDNQVQTLVRPYLDCYLRNMESNKTIFDVEFPTWDYATGQPTSWRTPTRNRDSDDSYAATFVALAARYVSRLKNHATYGANVQSWWLLNRTAIKDIAYLNLLVPLKANGLTPTFRPDLPIPPHIATDKNYPTVASQLAACQVGYLMDNCEVYFGLSTLVSLLRAQYDPQASYFSGFLGSIATGISRLYRATSKAYLVSDVDSAITGGFYPGATCQVFPTAFQVTPEITAGRAGDAWAYFNSNAGNWYRWPNGGSGANNSPDPYPWAILAYAAAVRCKSTTDTALLTKAKTWVSKIEANFSVSTQRPFITANELGFYLGAKRLL